MNHNSETFYIIMGILAVFGILASAVYYFFRFGFKTDFDKDLEQQQAKELPSVEDRDPTQKKIEESFNKQAPDKVAVPVGEVLFGDVPQQTPEPKNLQTALSKTRESFFSRLKSVFADGKLNDSDLESLEEVLYTSDLGPQTVQRLMDAIDEKLQGDEKKDLDKVVQALKQEMRNIFSELDFSKNEKGIEEILGLPQQAAGGGLKVWLIVGVNGAGKTTTIGKLANIVARSGKKVMVAAGDTFRAAAGDQLKIWSERAQVEIFSPPNVKDPSAVAFDACATAKAKGYDILIVDTAGRLHTHSNLMSELDKMNRVMKKVIPDAPHETLLVLDANSGQNALVQAKQFNDVVELSGVVLTKLDGSAKGGVAVGLAHELGLPIRLIGIGEGIDDLRPFQPNQFVDSIL